MFKTGDRITYSKEFVRKEGRWYSKWLGSNGTILEYSPNQWGDAYLIDWDIDAPIRAYERHHNPFMKHTLELITPTISNYDPNQQADTEEDI